MALLPVKISIGILVWILSGILWCCIKKKSSWKPSVWFLLLFCCVLGYLRMGYENVSRPWEGYVTATRGKTVEIQGQIMELSEKEKVYGLTLSQCTMVWKAKSYEMPDMLVYIDKEEFNTYEKQIIVRMGMRISLSGKPEKPDVSRNPGEFNFRMYYRSLGIQYQVFGEKFQIIDSSYLPYQDGIYRFRLAAIKRLEQLCAPEDLGIFQAAILGDKSSLDEGTRELYQRNGIAHLLAISGLHISLVGLGVYRILRKLGAGYGMAGSLGGLVIITYGILTGSSASVVRAVAMVLIYMLAEYLGRCYDMLSAAALAGILLLVESPYLVLQAGVQLSFGAVFAIGGLGPWLSRELKPSSRFGNALIPGIAIQLVTYPIILYHFFQYPTYGIFLNLIVIPLMQYVILSGILGIFLGTVWVEAGVFALGSGHYLLKLYVWLCQQWDKIPGANLVIGRPEIWQIVLYYILLGGVLWWVYRWGHVGGEAGGQISGGQISGGQTSGGQISGRHRSGENLSAGKGGRGSWRISARTGYVRWIGFLCGYCVCFFLLWQMPVKGLQVTCLDVGQGDGICIQTDQIVILMDGGSTSKKELGKFSLEPYLKSRGISRIDYAIVSHGDMDHISGLLYLLDQSEEIRIEHLMLPWLGKGDEAYAQLVELMEARGGTVHWMRSGEWIRSGKLLLTCLYHGDEKKKADMNEHSLMLRLDYGQFEMIFTGDMSSEGEMDLLNHGISGSESLGTGDGGVGNRNEKFRILKVAHHGSKYSTCEELLHEINPRHAIISYKEGNSYGHPHKEVLKRLEKQDIRIWKTAESGAVTFYTDGEKMWVRELLLTYRSFR